LPQFDLGHLEVAPVMRVVAADSVGNSGNQGIYSNKGSLLAVTGVKLRFFIKDRVILFEDVITKNKMITLRIDVT
jgi:hypothetical protein